MLSVKDIICRVYCGILVVIWILAPYAILQNVAIYDVYWMPELAIDRAIPVNFSSMWLYVSYCLLLCIVGLTLEKRVFIRYLYTIGWTTLVTHMIFLFFPNGVSREAIDLDVSPWVYQLLASTDAPRNAFPSLHGSLSVIAGLAVQASEMKRVSGSVRKILKSLTWFWILGILWSTIALRQHVILDLVVGGVIGWVVWRWMKNSWEMNHHFPAQEESTTSVSQSRS